MIEAMVTLAAVLFLVVMVARKVIKQMERRRQEIAILEARSTPAAKAQTERDKKARQSATFWAGF